MWCDEADEADGARHGDGCADAERDREDDDKAQPAHVEAQAFGRLLAQREQAEALAVGHEQHGCHDDEGQGQQDMAHAAVFQRAQQPEGDLERCEGVRGQVHRERRARAGEAGHGEAGEDQQKQGGSPTCHRDKQRDRGEGPEDRRDGQTERERGVQTQRQGRDRGEGGGLRGAEKRGLRQRIAQQALHGGAGKAQDRADREREDGARQPDLRDDDAARIVRRRAESRQHVGRRQADRADAKRDDGQGQDEKDERGKRPAPPFDALVPGAHHVARKPA